MDQLAAQQVDSFQKLFDNHQPAFFDVPTLGVKTTLCIAASRLLGGLRPEVSIEVGIPKDGQHESFVFHENRLDMIRSIDRQYLLHKPSPTSTVGRRLP